MPDSDRTGAQKPPMGGRIAQKQEALNAFLVAADEHARRGEVIEAEVRFKQALYTAEKEFGEHSDQVMLVLSILAAFYHFQNRRWDARNIETRIEQWQMKNSAIEEQSALQKQLSAKKPSSEAPRAGYVSGRLTAELRKACQILGLSPNEPITAQTVNRAWKTQMLAASAHPDLGGNTDEAVILNKAKETLMNYMESLEPNLGKKFKKS